MQIIKSEFLGFNSENESLQRIIGFCTSSESKPTENIKNGSKLTELDTGDVYFFDEDIGWQKVVVGEGGGSDLPEVTADDKNKYLHTNSSTGNLEWSAVSGGVFVITTTYDESTETTTLNSTWQEIWDAVTAGKIAVVTGYTTGSEQNAYMQVVQRVFGYSGAYSLEAYVGTFIPIGEQPTTSLMCMVYSTDNQSGYPTLTYSV